MKKSVKILRNILIGIVAFVAVFFAGVFIYFRAPVHSYYKVSKKAFVIPGEKDGFIAQGISYDAGDDLFYVTGYMLDGSASPIYMVNKTTKKCVKSVKMAKPDGTAYTGHAGGISVLNDKVYVAGGEEFNVYSIEKQAIKAAADKSSVAISGEVDLNDTENGVGVAFTTTRNGMLYAGEFYRLPSYPTYPKHEIATADGVNNAIMIGLEPDGNGFTPAVAYSLPGNVQGASFAQGKLYLSTSWGPAFSNIYVYDEAKLSPKGTFSFQGKELPLYILDSTNLEETKKIAPMSEEIEYVDGRFYIMCESASNKYIFGKFTGAKWCYASKW